jgi:hypothetical protein
MSLYTRPGGGAPVHWNPDYEQIGKEAVESVVGATDTFPVEVDGSTAKQIREEYQRLVKETSGGAE